MELMKKIIAIGASNSTKSINRKFATWTAKQIPDAEVTVLDLNDFEMPIYSMEHEQEQGVPKLAQDWRKLISEADGVVVSFAEHNSSYTVAFKNIFDWVSRLDGPAWQNKPILLLATSPGPRGAQTVLATAKASFPYHGAKVAGSFSLPSFNKSFDEQQGVTELGLKDQIEEHLSAFRTLLDQERITA